MAVKTRAPYAIGVDIGGTTIRSALVSARGAIRRGSHIERPVHSKGAAEEILRTFCAVMAQNIQQSCREGLSLVAIGIGMCGPQDYEQGIPLMKGLDKYDALYGMNLKKEFRARLGLAADFPIAMEVDTWSFARGEAWLGAGKGFRRILALTLGTGFGSAFVADGELLGEGPGIPAPLGWIGSLPFRDGLLDDVISRRGILSLYTGLSGKPLPPGWDVRHIAEAARAGDALCLEVFDGFGHLLGAALTPIIQRFQAECLLFGGRISQSLDLFEDGLRCGLSDVPSLRHITLAKSISRATLWGAARLAFLHARQRVPAQNTEK